ncbi:MAG: GspH/FimT family pseudopilin [Candidatus Accumulibacter sp. UW26]|jgi:type IV fimbrial biogenesis protein FimT
MMPGRGLGFTLIEVMVVVALLSVLLGLGAPAFSRYVANVRLRSTAETVLADLQKARTTAIRENSNVTWAATGSSGAIVIGASVSDIDGGDALVFTPFGGTTLSASAVFSFTNPAAGACHTDEGPVRCLNIIVTTGGRVRLCDPGVSEANDTRACPS